MYSVKAGYFLMSYVWVKSVSNPTEICSLELSNSTVLEVTWYIGGFSLITIASVVRILWPILGFYHTLCTWCRWNRFTALSSKRKFVWIYGMCVYWQQVPYHFIYINLCDLLKRQHLYACTGLSLLDTWYWQGGFFIKLLPNINKLCTSALCISGRFQHYRTHPSFAIMIELSTDSMWPAMWDHKRIYFKNSMKESDSYGIYVTFYRFCVEVKYCLVNDDFIPSLFRVDFHSMATLCFY
jgi:hypothetical protein